MKLNYFDMPGRGEVVRLALAAGGLTFEDNRISFADWPALKPKTPYGSLPYLEKDGKQLAQTQAILRYVGKVGGLYPTEDHWLAAEVDEVLGFIMDDINGPLLATFSLPPEERKAKRTALFDGPMQARLAQLDKRIESNGSGFCVGESMTIADVTVSALVQFSKSGIVDELPTDVLDSYTNIMKCNEKVTSDANVAAYMAAQTK